MDKFFTDQVSKEHNVLCVEYKGKNEVKIIISDNRNITYIVIDNLCFEIIYYRFESTKGQFH